MSANYIFSAGDSTQLGNRWGATFQMIVSGSDLLDVFPDEPMLFSSIHYDHGDRPDCRSSTARQLNWHRKMTILTPIAHADQHHVLPTPTT